MLHQTQYAWAHAEVAPWSARAPRSKDAYAQALYAVNENTTDTFIFDINGSNVSVRPKTNPNAQPGNLENIRLPQYIDLFHEAARNLKPDTQVSLAVCVGDKVTFLSEFPILTFQKASGSDNILIPDPDFLGFDYYKDELEERNYQAKTNQVVFCGSSTGKMLTEDDVRDDNSERLQLAKYFDGNDKIIIKIGAAVQCITENGTIQIQRKPYYRPMTWAEQLEKKFILSLDGNGATCSRVALTLRSQSLLLKYKSDERLYYFHGLRPMEHYLSVQSAEDLEHQYLALCSDETLAKTIIANANRFFASNLRREQVQGYLTHLIEIIATEYISKMT